MIGMGEPGSIRAGVAGGRYFDVMGLHPLLGRLIDPQDGPEATRRAGILGQRSNARIRHPPGPGIGAAAGSSKA